MMRFNLLNQLWPELWRLVTVLLAILLSSNLLFAQRMMAPGFAQAFSLVRHPLAAIQLDPTTISTVTGQKPQSKVWRYHGHWWLVVPSPEGPQPGTKIWRLDGLKWTPVLTVHSSLLSQADVVVDGPRVHLVWVEAEGKHGEARAMRFASLVFDPASERYLPWPKGPGVVTLPVNRSVETAAMDMDSAGRLWIAYEEDQIIKVLHSQPPYDRWEGPVALNRGEVSSDDICDITAFGGDRIGVMWSDQHSGAFYFRYHDDGTDPKHWSEQEIAWKASGWSNADDHISLAAASDGTIYAAVKTGGTDQLGLLVRDYRQGWDQVFHLIDIGGTRPIVVLNEIKEQIYVFYNLENGFNDVVCRQSAFKPIAFGPELPVTSGEAVKNVSSVRNRFDQQVIIVAGSKPDEQHRAYLLSRLILSGQVLPAELNGLWSWREGDAVVLYWRVSNEVLSDGFVVLRGVSAEGPFKPVASFQTNGLLVARGGQDQSVDYQFVDENPPLDVPVYYRLYTQNFARYNLLLGITHVNAIQP